nr:PREDICTED: rho GTPase-activating protein 11A isoform X1 [Lepisosteus oculatus]
MRLYDRNVIRLAIVQHLRVYGIRIKNWNKNKGSSSKVTACYPAKIFGVPLESLPQCSVAEYGTVPRFLVDACENLLQNVDTEGLFRKSGSVVRLKELKAKLDMGEDCIPSALPCDIAGLLKQFFRELPEPAIPTELHDALLKAQQLLTEEERTTATHLLSCMLPDGVSQTLRYFFNFLKNVSQRSAKNKMDSSNLSVIFAPNLLHSSNVNEKMTVTTEKRLKQQAAIVHYFIEHADTFGSAPHFIMEKIPAMLGVDGGLATPTLESRGEGGESEFSDVKKRRRRSVGEMVNGALHKLKTNRTPTNTPQFDGSVISSATPVILTPNSKRKLPHESAQGLGFSNKKRRSLKHNLALELLPNIIFGSGSTPGSGHTNDASPSTSLDSSHGAVSSAGGVRHTANSAKRKSKRIEYKKVNRVESGKAGCFSPRVCRKEVVRKSLRLRFSLGKSSRDSSVISNSFVAPKGSESIGWRLATQESDTSFGSAKDAAFSPVIIRNKCTRKGSRYISKSEENLLTPQCDPTTHRTSWNGASPVDPLVFSDETYTETPMGKYLKSSYFSEPALISGKPPIIAGIPKDLRSTSSSENLRSNNSFTEDENSVTGTTLLKIKKAFTESGSNLCSLIGDRSSPQKEIDLKEGENDILIDSVFLPESNSQECESYEKNRNSYISPQKDLMENHHFMFDQRGILSESPSLESCQQPGSDQSDASQGIEQAVFQSNNLDNDCALTGEAQILKSSFIEDLNTTTALPDKAVSDVVQSPLCTSTLTVQLLKMPAPPVSDVSRSDMQVETPRMPDQNTEFQKNKLEKSPVSDVSETIPLRVADHIQRFTVLSLNDHTPKTKTIKSPLKFQRTPVRQSVRRINSLLAERRPTGGMNCSSEVTTPTMVKSVSHESGLFSKEGLCFQNPEDPIPCYHPGNEHKKLSNSTKSFIHQTKQSALGDVTNKVQQKPKVSLLANKNNSPNQTNAERSIMHHIIEKEKCRFKGSPKNPLPEGKFLSTTRAIDL